MKNEIRVTEYKDIRVLTTLQLSEAYETESDIINRNFNNNKGRYLEGKHYILLQGEELRQAKASGKFYGLQINTNKFYLWTEKGAFLHAKSLNTDKAWEVYEALIDTYFYKKETPCSITVAATELPIGEIANYMKEMDRVMYRQNSKPYKVAETFKMVSEQFGIHLPENFVEVPEYEQLALNTYIR